MSPRLTTVQIVAPTRSVGTTTSFRGFRFATRSETFENTGQVLIWPLLGCAVWRRHHDNIRLQKLGGKMAARSHLLAFLVGYLLGLGIPAGEDDTGLCVGSNAGEGLSGQRDDGQQLNLLQE